MKVNHGDHDYLKQLKDPLEKYLCVFFCTNQILRIRLPFFSFSMRSNLTFLTFQKRNNIKIGHFRNITFVVYLIIETLCDCKNVIHFSAISCRLIFFNLDEIGSYFFNRMN